MLAFLGWLIFVGIAGGIYQAKKKADAEDNGTSQ